MATRASALDTEICPFNRYTRRCARSSFVGVKAAALVIGLLVLGVGGWKVVGPGGDSLGPKLKDTLNEYPLMHRHHPGVVEAVKCEDEVGFVGYGDIPYHQCVVRYEDGVREPWCVARRSESPLNGLVARGATKCSDVAELAERADYPWMPEQPGE